MAECAVARCVQERRALRRELHKWGKDILLIVGFESIAEGLLGEETWSTFSNYTFEEKSGYATDWTPENICCFCNLRKCPLPDPARGICPVDGTVRNGVEDNDAINDPDGHYLFGSCPLLGGDQPLDLSMGSSKSKAHTYWALMAERQAANSDGACPSLLKVPQLPTHPGKLKRRLESLACKRSYTDDELQAALGDIRSGRLGTRRAAVIYGIPRSTLRNKVYKLALESGLGVPVKHRGPSPVKAEADVDVTDMSAPTSTPDTFVANKPEETRSVSESLRTLIRNRMVERAAMANAATNLNINPQSAPVATNRATANGNGWLRGLEPLLSRVLTNVQHFTTERNGYEGTGALGPFADSVSEHPVLLPNLIRRLAEERFQEERRRLRPATTGEIHSPKVTTTNTNNVILKIPSYKPTKNCCVAVGRTPTMPRSSQITPMKKQVISKDVTSTRRVAKKDVVEEEEDEDCDDGDDEGEDDEREDDDEDEDDEEDEKDEDTDGSPSSVKGRKVTQMDRLDKRIRPKRGRYRNYQKADLAEAVRAVRRGQMSVHRAGSYFGVPHSTLEYKVKERHLLRSSRKCKRVAGEPRKNRPIGGGSPRKDAEAASSCCSSNSSSLSGGEVVVVGGGNKCNVEQGTSLWPSGQMLGVDLDLNSENFFASQMMKKLQQDARLSQEQHKQQQSSYGVHDTLLLSVLLRSGLAVQPKRSSSSTNSSLSSSNSTLPHQSPAHLGTKNCSAQV